MRGEAIESGFYGGKTGLAIVSHLGVCLRRCDKTTLECLIFSGGDARSAAII